MNLSDADLNYDLLKALSAKDTAENLLWRDVCWLAGHESAETRDALMIACSRDILFWLNTFFWIFEPRPKRLGHSRSKSKCIPFITYKYQDRAVLNTVRHIRMGEDLEIWKSRDMGATWICLAVFLWFWLFEPDCMFLAMSAKEEMVDKTGNPKALFYKLMYAVNRLPAWMLPEHKRAKMHLSNEWNRSVIDGEATQPNATVSDRRMAILFDEFAKVDNVAPGLGAEILGVTADATDCRIFNSTPMGHDSGFFVVHESKTDKETLHWSEHPVKNPGLYRVSAEGKVEILDEKWHLENPGYDFQLESGGWEGLRSPWYDVECIRRHSAIRIARELDMSFGGSGDPFFKESEIIILQARDIRPAFATGRAEDFLKETFEDGVEKPFQLWFYPDIHGRPDQSTTYTIATDIAQGTGASDSVLSVADDRTRALAAQYTSNRIRPEIFADLTVAICNWFTTPLDQPFLIWDGGGPGASYGPRIVVKLRYTRVYRYKNLTARKGTRASSPGWPSNRQLKYALLSQFRTALSEGTYTTRSDSMLHQCMQYIYDGKDGVEHIAEKITDYKSGMGRQHGDKVISEALLVEGMFNRPIPPEKPFRIPENCYAYREQRAMENIEREKNQRGRLGW